MPTDVNWPREIEFFVNKSVKTAAIDYNPLIITFEWPMNKVLLISDAVLRNGKKIEESFDTRWLRTWNLIRKADFQSGVNV